MDNDIKIVIAFTDHNLIFIKLKKIYREYRDKMKYRQNEIHIITVVQ